MVSATVCCVAPVPVPEEATTEIWLDWVVGAGLLVAEVLFAEDAHPVSWITRSAASRVNSPRSFLVRIRSKVGHRQIRNPRATEVVIPQGFACAGFSRSMADEAVVATVSCVVAVVPAGVTEAGEKLQVA